MSHTSSTRTCRVTSTVGDACPAHFWSPLRCKLGVSEQVREKEDEEEESMRMGACPVPRVMPLELHRLICGKNKDMRQHPMKWSLRKASRKNNYTHKYTATSHTQWTTLCDKGQHLSNKSTPWNQLCKVWLATCTHILDVILGHYWLGTYGKLPTKWPLAIDISYF